MLILKKPWDSQPQEAVEVNWGNPLAQGLVRLISFSDNGLAVDLISNTQLALVGTNSSPIVTPQGRGVSVTGSGGDTYWSSPILSETVQSFSMGWLGRMDAAGSASIFVRDSTGLGGTILFWRNAGWDMRVGATDYTAAGNFNLGEMYSALVSSGASTASFHVGGRKILSGPNGSSALVSPWVIGKNGTNSTGPLHSTLLIPIWNRPLTDAEAAEWTNNPWQLFEPQSIRIPVTVGIGGAYSLNLESGSYTITGGEATLLHGYLHNLGPGTYTLTGSDATLLKNSLLNLESGSYTISGSDITFELAKVMNMESGSYSLTGSDITVLRTYQLNATSGSYTLTGQDVTFVYSGASNTVTIKAGSWLRYRTIQ